MRPSRKSRYKTYCTKAFFGTIEFNTELTTPLYRWKFNTWIRKAGTQKWNIDEERPLIGDSIVLRSP
jgi:hypothetical protein